MKIRENRNMALGAATCGVAAKHNENKRAAHQAILKTQSQTMMTAL
jgi:hypothetical protein